MSYKVVLHSKKDGYVVYRKFHWDRKRQHGLVGFLSVVLLSVGTFMLLPTPEDFIEVGWLSRFLAKHYQMANGTGIFYAIAIIKGTALVIIGVSVALGGKYIRDELTKKIKRHKVLSL